MKLREKEEEVRRERFKEIESTLKRSRSIVKVIRSCKCDSDIIFVCGIRTNIVLYNVIPRRGLSVYRAMKKLMKHLPKEGLVGNPKMIKGDLPIRGIIEYEKKAKRIIVDGKINKIAVEERGLYIFNIGICFYKNEKDAEKCEEFLLMRRMGYKNLVQAFENAVPLNF